MKSDFEIGLDSIRARARPAPADGGEQVTVRDVTPNTGRTGGFSIFDPGVSVSYTKEPTPPPPAVDPAQKGSLTSDAVNLMGLGMDDMATALRWATGKVLGPGAVDFIDKLGGTSEAQMAQARAEREAKLSGATRSAMKKEFVTETPDAATGETKYGVGEAWSDPRAYFALIMQSVPGTVASMGPSFAIARAAGTRVLQAQLAKGATQEVAKKAAGIAAQRAALVAGGASEGAISGAQVGQQVEQQIGQLPIEVLRTSEAFQELVKLNGGDESAARQKLASDRAWRGALMAGVATAAFGGQGDVALQKILGGEIKGFFKKVGAGALSEGLFEELPQSVGEQVSKNVAVGAADPRVTPGQGVANAGVSGLVAGAGMGAGFSAAAAPFEDRRAAPPATGTPLVAETTPTAPVAPGEVPPTRAPRTPDADESMPPPPTGMPEGALGQSDPYADEAVPRDRGGEPPAPPAPMPPPERAPRTPDPDETLGAPQWDQVETRQGPSLALPEQAPVPLAAYADDQRPRARVDTPVYTPQVGDIAGIGGRPFMSRAVAESRAKSTGGIVIDHPSGGFVVRPGAGEQVQTGSTKPNPPTDLPPDQGGGSPGEPPAGPGGGGAATPESNPDVQAAIDEIGKILGVDSAAAEAATSPTNDLPEPTEAQKEAGNYKKGHTKIGGLPLAIENPAGTRRRPEWPELPAHYGYVKGTTGKDGDQVDVFVKPGTSDEYAGPVYVIDQSKEKGGFDEHKVMVGYGSQEEATAAYKSAYTPDWKVGPVTELPWEQFRNWVDNGDHTKPLSAPKPEPKSKIAAEVQAAKDKQAPDMGGRKPFVDDANSIADRALDVKAAMKKKQTLAGEKADHQQRAELREAYEILRAQLMGVLSNYEEAFGKEARAALEATPKIKDAIDRSDIISVGRQDNIAAAKRLKKHDTVKWYSPHTYTVDGKKQTGRWFTGTIKGIDRNDGTVDVEQGEGGPRSSHGAAGLELVPVSKPDVAVTKPAKSEPQAPKGVTGEPRSESQLVDEATAFITDLFATGKAPEKSAEAYELYQKHIGPERKAGEYGETKLSFGWFLDIFNRTQKNPPARKSAIASEVAAAKDKEAMAQAKAEAAEAIDQLASILGVKKNINPEQRAQLLPVLSKLMGALLKMGYLEFKAAARKALEMLRAKLGPDAGGISAVDLRSAYNVVAQDYEGTTPEDEVAKFKTISEIESDEKPTPPPSDTKAKPDVLVDDDIGKLTLEQLYSEAESEFVNAVLERLVGANATGFASINDVRKLWEDVTGKEYEPNLKRIDELTELAVVRAVRDRVEIIANKKGGPALMDNVQIQKGLYDVAVSIYNRMPRLGTRTSTSVEQQAYSTPAPLAMLTQLMARAWNAKSVYEPSAGNGMLLTVANPQAVVANELNPGRVKALQIQDFRTVTQQDATNWEPGGGNFDLIITNPPFGHIKGREGVNRQFELPLPDGKTFDTPEIDHAIAMKALQKLKDDGTAVLILGSIPKTVTGEAARGDAYNGQNKRRFFYALYKQFNVVDHFTVSGELYAKQGAAWPVDVILIKGRGESTLPLPAIKPPRIYDTWDGLKGLFDANRLDAGQQGSVRGPAGGAPGAAGTQPGDVPVGTGPAAAGNRDAGQGSAGGGQPVPAGSGGGGSGAGTYAGGRPPAGGPSADGGGAAGTTTTTGPAATGAAQGGTQFAPGGSGTGTGQNGPGGSTTANGGNAAPPAVNETGTNENQLTYHPQSALNSLGTLVPTNQADAVKQALATLADRVGDIDQFVMRELRYKSLGELGDAFAAEQIDALALAIDSMHRGSGFIIGDQTGIGKGRVVAGIIRWTLLNGHIPIFTTEKPNLYGDMIRDLSDIGVDDIRPLMTNNSESIPIDSVATDYYADHLDAVASAKALGRKAPHMARAGSRPGLWLSAPQKDQNEALQTSILAGGGTLDALKAAGYNMIFTTYNQMNRDSLKDGRGKPTGQYKDETRHTFIRTLANGNSLILDETHNAGGQKASRGPNQGLAEGRGAFFRQLVDIARSVFYSSATYAKRTDVMDLYSKTDMSKAVAGNVAALPEAIEKGGVPLMQVVSSMLVQAGQYIRRERSFNGVRYDTDSVVVDKVAGENLATTFKLIKDFDNLKAAAVDDLDDQIKTQGGALGDDNSMGNAGATSTNFTSLMHNVVNQMLLALKAKQVVDYAVQALNAGEKPVITLANTMGSFIERYTTDFNVSPGEAVALSFRDVLIRYLKKARDVRIKAPDGTTAVHYLTDDELGPTALAQWKAAEKHIRTAKGLDELPISPIDYLHSELRKLKHPSKNRNVTTGEITGRTHTIEYSATGMKFVMRPDSQTNAGARRVLVNQFNDDKVDVLILNQAGSTGLSLHSSSKFKNKQPRHMIILQPELNIDTHMQMLGRVHRTGQVVPPRFTQLAADIPAETRPASVLAKKMAALSANTTASRKNALAASNVIDFMNEYGDQVAADLMRDMPDIHQALDKPLVEDTHGFEADNALAKVTGRLPMLPLAEQKRVYDMLESNYKDYLAQKIALGENALEAQTLDLQAKTTERHTVFSGEVGDDSPFAAGAYAEVLDVKKLGKPYTWEELRKRIADFLTEKGMTGVVETDPMWRLSNSGHEWMRNLRAKVGDEFTAYMADLVAGMSDPDAIHATEARMRAAKNVFDRIATEIHPGGQYRLILTDGSSVMAVAMGIQRKKDVKMPVAPGAWSVDFAFADASRHVKIPFSHIVVGSADPGARQMGIQVSAATHDPVTRDSIELVFSKGQREVREQRVMLTGNLLAAYGRLPKGQIVNYTDADGRHLQGILLARGTDIKKLGSEMPVLLTAQQAARYFQLVKGTGALDTEDGALRIFKEGGEYQLRAKLSRSEGGKYYLNPAIRAITGDWTSRANTMRVEIPQIRGVELFQAINEIGQIVANQSREVAVQVGGSPFKPDADQPAASKLREPRHIQPTSEAHMRNVRKQVAAFMQQFPKANQLEVEVVARGEDIVEGPLRSFAGPGSVGIYSPAYGKVIVVAEMVQDAEHLNETLLHEVIGHYGTEALLGTKFASVIADVIRLGVAKGPVTGKERVGDANFATVESVRTVYGDLSDAQIAREVLARMAESGVRPTFMEMVYAKIRSALRALGIVRKYTNADLKQMVIDAATYLRTGRLPPGAPGGGPRGFKSMVDSPVASLVPQERDAMRVANAAISARRDLKAAAQDYWHRARALVDPMRTLPDKQRFMVERYLALGEVDRAEKMAESIRTVFMDANLTSQKQAMYYLTNRNAEPTAIADQGIREKAVWIKGEISKVADAMLDRGMITEASREKYRDEYLPQLYLKHVLATETGTRAAGAGRKPSTQGYLKARQYRWTVGPEGDIVVKETASGRTLTQDEVLSLGLIDDPGYLSVVAIAKPLRDMALLDWLAKISVNEQWAHPSSFVRWNGHRVTAHWLLEEAGRIERQSEFYQGENKADALDLVERMKRVAKEGIAAEEAAKAGNELLLSYRQIPKTVRYGRLGGMWVRTEIYDDIMGIHDFIPADHTLVGSLFGYGGIGTKVTAWWKMMKVALNIPAQVRNWVSNGVLLQLSGVPLHRIPDYVIRSAREVFDGQGPFYDIAKRYGVDAATFTSNELAAIDRDLLELNAKLRDLTPYEKLQSVMEPIAKWAGDRYQTAEAIFKTAKIMHILEQGGWADMPAGAAKSDLEAQAAIEAHEWLFDYSLVSKELRYARNAPVGAPFITFTAKVLPKLVDVALHHPQRFLPWIALFASAPYMVAMMVGADDGEDIDKLNLSMQKWMQERGHIMILPFRDADGRWQVVDLGYFMPWSFYTDLVPLSMRTVRRTFEGDLAAAKDSLGDDWANTNVAARMMGLIGGPIPDLLVAMKTGRDPFTGREIAPVGATGGQKLAAWSNYAWDVAMPPMLSSRGTLSPMGLLTGAASGEWDFGGKAVQAARGDTNRWGDPRATPLQAGLGLFGVNTSALDPEQTRATNIMQMRREIEGVRILMIQKLRNQSLSPDERKEILDEGTEEMRKRLLKMQEYLKRSQLPPDMLTQKRVKP